MASISQLTARLVDLFGTPSTANPAKLLGNLGVSPNGNVLVGTSTDATTTTKLQVAGGLAINAQDTVGAQLRLVQGNYGAMWRQDGTILYLLSTASGAQYGTWNAYRPFTFNMTTGAVQIAADGSAISTGSRPTFNGNLAWDAGNFNPASYVTTGGLAYTASHLRVGGNDSTWNWAGQGGTPSYVWGGSDGVNMYVWSPANFSVNYANSAGSAGTVTGSVQSGNCGEFSHLRATQNYSSGGGTGLSFQGCTMSWNDNNGDGGGWLGNNQGGGTSGWVIRTVNSNNTAELGRFTISAGGVGTNGSDIRLKDNVETLTDSLSKIRSIRGVSYNYKSNGEAHYGVIAQEVQPYFPDAVTLTHKGENDPSGHPDDMLGVSYNDLIAPLIEAVKELADKVDAQSEEIASLKAQLGKQ